MKKYLFVITIISILLGTCSCSSKKDSSNNGDNAENAESIQEEPDMDALASRNLEAMEQFEEEMNTEPDSPFNEVGTLGTMELKRSGQTGDPNFPNSYRGDGGWFIDGPAFSFDCYPYSRFGDDDIASFTWSAYNIIGKDNNEYSISVPSYVVLEGKTYRVERVQIGNWREKDYAASKYILPSTIKYFNFANLKHLKEVVLSEGIDTISLRAFWGCVDLENVVIPSTVKKSRD